MVNRLQRTQIKRDIKEMKQLIKLYPYQYQLRSELRRMKRELNQIERALEGDKK